MDSRRSIGQGRHHSHVSYAGNSVVQRLVSSSITGSGLGIEVHQHFGHRLRLVWNVNNHGKPATLCLQRVFRTYEDVNQFCTDITDGGLEGLCACLGAHVLEWLQDKVEHCTMEPPTHSQVNKYRDVPRSWVRALQELKQNNMFRCYCPISPSYFIHWV